jgi:hypothetical protein
MRNSRELSRKQALYRSSWRKGESFSGWLEIGRILWPDLGISSGIGGILWPDLGAHLGIGGILWPDLGVSSVIGGILWLDLGVSSGIGGILRPDLGLFFPSVRQSLATCILRSWKPLETQRV